jgi:hypothetical protein
MKGSVERTFVNGQLAYENGKVLPVNAAQRLEFNR